MKNVILISLGERDRFLTDGADFLAAREGVAVADVSRLDNLAERALRPQDGVIASCFARKGAYVVGCSRPRAARALLESAGIACADLAIDWVALPFDREALKREPGTPWYPVIDRARCSDCGTCRDYCLFSVYGGGDGAVRVQAPLNCKTGCPACARLCPEAALIFPFCAEAELNGEIDEPARRAPDALADALGDDPMRVLAERRDRRRLIDPAKFGQAERERAAHSGGAGE